MNREADIEKTDFTLKTILNYISDLRKVKQSCCNFESNDWNYSATLLVKSKWFLGPIEESEMPDVRNVHGFGL